MSTPLLLLLNALLLAGVLGLAYGINLAWTRFVTRDDRTPEEHSWPVDQHMVRTWDRSVLERQLNWISGTSGPRRGLN
ncbi:hypothetical protein [Deinococcus sonorensis]|uniref:Uncharacterized protein n=2 Tax=Deinococcus sonorensis TaxID=309891 RepID=A0AAU7U4F2_9DEIO